MPTIVIGQTSKPINSTSRVFYAGGTTINNVRLKEPCSMQSPIFRLSKDHISREKNYNFLKWSCSDYDRYYWIEDMIYKTNDIIDVHCRLDPLATFRDAIKNNNYFVRYGDSTHWNQYVDDLRMMPEMQAPYVQSAYFNLFEDTQSGKVLHFTKSQGTVIIRVMETASQDVIDKLAIDYDAAYGQVYANEHQGVKTYAMKYSDFITWVWDVSTILHLSTEDLFSGSSSTDWAGEYMQASTRLWGGVIGAGGVADNVIACFYLPIKYTDIFSIIDGTQDICIFVGGIPAKVDCYKLDSPVQVWTGLHTNVTLPWSPKAAKPGFSDLNAGNYSYLRNDRWADFQIFTPGGVTTLPTALIKEQDEIGIWSSLNIMTGDWAMRITEQATGYGSTLTTFGGNLGCNLMEFVGSGESWSSMSFQYGAELAGKIAGAILQAYTSIPVGEAVTTKHTKSNTAAPALTAAGNPSSRYISENVEEDVTTSRDIMSTGINFGFTPSGVNKTVPTGSMSGSIAENFLLTEPSQTEFGKCQIANIQYLPVDNANYGRFCTKEGFPVNKWLNLQNEGVSGFIICTGAYLDYVLGATPANLSTINSFLNSGIYIEE